MARHHPATWLAQKARTGVADLPSNAAWLLSKAVGEPAEAVASGVDTAVDQAKAGGRAGKRAVQRLPFGSDRGGREVGGSAGGRRACARGGAGRG